MGNQSRREIARLRTLAVMRQIKKNVDDEKDLNLTLVAREAGVSPSSFYRWLDNPPQKVDVSAIAAVADYLHEIHDHETFAVMWTRVSNTIK